MRLPEPLRRRLRRRADRLRARLRGWPLRLVYSRAYAFEWDEMPFDPVRGERILTALAAAGLAEASMIREPSPASFADLRRVHDDAYLDALADADALTRVFGAPIDPAAIDRIVDLQRSMVGGTIAATEWARAVGGVVANLGGGFHHAGPRQGAGFCLLNDLAVAIADQRARGFEGRVLIVDLDLHDGDGTRACFADDPSVFTLSIHNQDWGPSEAIASRSVALGPDVDDRTYLAAIDEHLPAVLREHRPALVYVVAGTDPAADDILGNWRITDDGMFARDRRVHELLAAHAPRAPVVVVLAGGYGPRTWRHSARALAWVQTGDDHFVAPSNEDLTMMRYRYLARRLTREELTGEADDEWGLTEDDIFPGLSGRPRRFLGFYAASGVELALERYGLLDRLRAKGYPRPTVVVDARAAGDADTVRIFGEPERQNLLIEVRLRRDRATLPGFEFLAVDWLLLQNPQAHFSAERPALPGQEHPGLGLFSEVVGLLLIICERLHLDGLAVVPSQYHLAVHWSRHLRFVDPRAEARFGGLQGALAGLELADAVTALAAGEVVDEGAGEAARYQASPMILPLSEALRRHLEEHAPAYAREREAERRRVALRRRAPAPGV